MYIKLDYSNACYNIRAIYGNNIIQENPDLKKSTTTFISISLSLYIFIFICQKSIFIMIILMLENISYKLISSRFYNLNIGANHFC